MSHISPSSTILSMEVSSRDDCEYRILVNTRVRYLLISIGTFDRSTLSMPLSSLPNFPDDDTWNFAYVRQDPTRGEVTMDLQQRTFKGITDLWHPVSVDCLDLTRTKQLTATTFEATYSGEKPLPTASSVIIAKIARFEWEIPRLEAETLVYRSLENTGLAPPFLGHVHEHGRVIGFLLEKLQGRAASLDDLSSCQSVLQRLHGMGILHGDVNRYNFIVQDETTRLIDFEHSKFCNGPSAAMQAEMDSLYDELTEETGRGGGFTR